MHAIIPYQNQPISDGCSRPCCPLVKKHDNGRDSVMSGAPALVGQERAVNHSLNAIALLPYVRRYGGTISNSSQN